MKKKKEKLDLQKSSRSELEIKYQETNELRARIKEALEEASKRKKDPNYISAFTRLAEQGYEFIVD